jgi:hypothetical protein
MPIVYTCGAFWKEKMGNSAAFTRYPLWLASYGVSTPAMVGGWSSFTFWQFTASGRMDGLSGSTDLNMFNGTAATLEAMSVPPAEARAAAAQAAAARAAAAQAAAARAAAAQAAATAEATASSALSTLRYTTRADTSPVDVKPADSRPAGPTSSRSSVRSWLGVHGLDVSRTIGSS